MNSLFAGKSVMASLLLVMVAICAITMATGEMEDSHGFFLQNDKRNIYVGRLGNPLRPGKRSDIGRKCDKKHQAALFQKVREAIKLVEEVAKVQENCLRK